MTALHETRAPTDAAPALDFDAIIIGAGMSGMYQLHRLREQGMRVRVFEAGTGVGGTWYWNRYPGARFDSESYSYGYSFSQELLAGMGLVGAFRRPAGNAALSQSCRRQVRPAPRHPVPQPGHGRHLGRGYAQLERHAAGRQPLPRALPDHRHRSALRPHPAADRRGGHVQGPVLPHRAMAARAGRLHGQARGGDRHRRHRRADHPDHRRQRRPPDRISAHAELVRAAAQRQDRRRDAEQRSRPAIPRCSGVARKPLPASSTRRTRAGPSKSSDEEREAFFEKLYAERGFGIWQGNFRDILIDRKANALISDFVARKIRQRVKDPKIAEKLIPQESRLRHEAAAAGDLLLRGLQPGQCRAGRHHGNADRADHARGHQDQRQGIRIRHHHLRHRLRRHHRQF